MVLSIPLTKGYEAKVDSADFARFGHLKWTALEISGKVYAHRKERDSEGKEQIVYLHRAILDAPDGALVDPRNGDGLDCQRKNLRRATYFQNRCNSKPLPNATGFIGVRSTPGGYFGRVTAHGRTHNTPKFACPQAAAAARDLLAQRLHGDFAVLNSNSVQP